MTATMRPSISACPACIAAPGAEDIAQRDVPKEAKLAISVPGVHCGACISTLERALSTHPGVNSARVNLTLKRALIEAEPHVSPEEIISTINAAGYEAYELDAGTLAATAQDKAGRDLLMRLAVAGFASMPSTAQTASRS